MGGRKWTNHEIAIIVYFASRKIDHQSCSRLLNSKTAGRCGNPRTAYGVRTKLERIRETSGLWLQATGWNLDAVDRWLLTLEVPNLVASLNVSPEEVLMISPVSRFLRFRQVETRSKLTQSSNAYRSFWPQSYNQVFCIL